MDELLKESLLEATAHVEPASPEPSRFEKEPADPAVSARIFRHIHTIKGGGVFLSTSRVGRFARERKDHGPFARGRCRDARHASPILSANRFE